MCLSFAALTTVQEKVRNPPEFASQLRPKPDIRVKLGTPRLLHLSRREGSAGVGVVTMKCWNDDGCQN